MKLVSACLIALSVFGPRMVAQDRAVRRVVSLLRKGKARTAVAEAELALKLYKSDPEVHVAAGLALLADGKLPDAMGQCDQAVRMKPDSGYAYLCRASVFAAFPQLDPFLTEVRQGLEFEKRSGNSMELRDYLHDLVIETLDRANVSPALAYYIRTRLSRNP